MVSTASDLLSFGIGLFDGALVSKGTVAMMAQPIASDIDSGILWGLGGGTIEGLPPGGFGMGGDIPGFHAFFMGFLDRDIVVAAVCNTEECTVMDPSFAALQYLDANR